MKKYRIRFKIKGNWLTWERFGWDMEATLKSAKAAIAKEYVEWKGGVMICGNQDKTGDEEIYAF